MKIASLSQITGRRFPAGRVSQNLVGGASPIAAQGFRMGVVALEPNGGQVPWHNHPQEEVYYVLEGTGEMCVGAERETVTAGQAIYIPPEAFHQLTNTGEESLRMLYCYAPDGDVLHWRQELDGNPAPRRVRSPASAPRRTSPAFGTPFGIAWKRPCTTIRTMTNHTIGIMMNGVTGRMGTNQHLLRSLKAIRDEGGIRLNAQETIVPDPILVGRNAAKLAALAERAGTPRWTTDLDSALSDPYNTVYFDAQLTDLRVASVKKAIAAGKHVYCEKPIATNTEEALELYLLAKRAGVKHGVVQDKLWLPGLRKLKTLRDTGFFGDVLSVRGDFGYWVFTGKDGGTPQRPSWNYRKEEGGGIILDMLCHWRYVLDNLFGKVQTVSCLGATHIPLRRDENGAPYACTADDSAYATFELEGGIIAQFNSSWCTRVRRDDLLTLQVDGTRGSAVAGLRECVIQPHIATPRPVWNPDVPSPIAYRDGWMAMPANEDYPNAFRAQWELFLRHIVTDSPFPWNLREGAKGVQLAEKGLESWHNRAWADIPDLPA